MTGEWPIREIDHINRKPDDNRWCNLRNATSSQNKWNSGGHLISRTGHRGVYICRNKWGVIVSKDRKQMWLGAFDTLDQALCVRNKAYQTLYGEYAPNGEDNLK